MNDTTTVGIEVRADGTQEAARDLAVVEASIRKVGKGLGEAAQYIGSAKLEKPIAGLDELAAKCNVSSRHMQNLARMMREVERERAFRQLAQDADLSTLQLAKFRAELGDTRGALATLSNGLGLSKAAMLAWAAAIAFVGKACFDAALEMDRLQKSYRTVMGSDIGATTQLDYIYGLTQKLGLQFQSTAESAKGFFAASVGTRLENDMNDIFKGVTSAGTALSMTQEQMSGVFLAFSQIASKGKLSMEEVNQIAERLPGTFELVSKAMGVNRQEMFKMIEQGKVMSDDLLPKLGVAIQEKFGDKAVEAANSAQGAVNRLSTEWEFFKSSASQTESIVQGINFVTDALKEAKNVLNKNNIVKEMSSKGYKTGQIFTQSYWNGPYTDQEIEAVQKYGEAVINADRQIDLVIAARLQKQREYEAEHQANVKRALKIEQDGMTAWKDATKDLPTFKLMAIDKAEKEALKKLDEWHTRGTLSEKEYQEKKIQIETGYAEKRKSITDKGAKSAEAEANRAAKALAAYDEELAKLTQSSRELEQVKIEEKLAKIAKDAKLPAAEIEKLRKAMEQEADFEWMQDILSYADPAAAAVAKVDKEYEAFLRNVEYLKKTDPAKYTQLMTKAETEHEKALCKAERASEEQNKHLQERLSFYKELEEMSGAFGLSLEVQNRLLDEQMEIFRDADIPENLIQTWRQYKDLMNSHDWADGAQRAFLQYRADATDAAKGAEEAFSSLYSGMDSGWKSAWQQMLEDGKVSLSSFRSLFASFLADLMHMAITRPITVQIAGVVSGMFGTGGVAYAAGGSGGGGGMGNLSGVSNLMPGSWFSGIGDTINNTMAGWFPGTFSSATAASSFAGQAAVSSALAEFGAGTSMATETAFNALADGIVAQNAAQSTFLSSVTPYFTAAGLGSLGYSMLGGKLGLPQSKYSGLTAGLGAAAGWGLGGMAAGSAALAGTGMAAGATFGSVVPVVGTIIGAIAGGALGSLFGQERKTHPSVYGHMMDQGYTTDAQSYIDAFMEQATYDRAGKTEASAYAQVIGEAASQTAGNILNLAAMLPDEYKKSVEDQLESATWSAGRGYSGASWNLQNWKEGMAEERIQEAVDDMFEQMGYGANKAFAEAGIGELFDSFDLSTEEGFKKAQTAISAISSITTAIDEIKAPTSEAEQQAKAFVAQMDALGEAVKASGLNAAYADKMIGEYRTAYVDSYVKSLDEMFNPLSEIEQQAKSYKESIDSRVAALTTMSASEAQLAKVRGYTQKAIDSIVGSLDAAFFPLSDVEKQTKSTMELLTAYENALKTLGDTGNGLAKVDEARAKVQSDLLDKARAYVSTTPEVVSQAAAMNAEFDALREAMLLAGNATADLTELEQIRAQAVAALQAQYVRSFDQGLAQRYATLNGTSDAVSRAISQENELRETITKFGEDSAQVSQLLHIQAAENVAAAQAAVDSLQNQLNSLKQQAIQAEISSITEQLNAAKTLKETWERLSESLYDSRAKLWTSDADALGLFAQRDAAQSEFDRLYRLTMQGDSEAAAKLASSGDTLLSLLKETSANGEQYTAGFWDVEQKLKDAESVAGKQLSEAQKSYNTLESQLKAQQSMLDALGYNNNSLDAINAQIVTVGNQLAKALGNLNAAQSNPNYGGTTSGGGYVSWEDKLLQEKADALNAGQTLAPGQTAGGWTPDKVLSAIKENGWTVADWYNYHGKAEGFAAGGLTPLNEMFSVGEAGKEYMLSPYQYVVLNNSMTRKLDEMQTLYRQTRQPVIDYRLMQMPVMGTDGDATAEIVKLREEVSELKNILRQTLTKTDTISANSGKIYRMAQKWDSDGLPATRTS